MTNRLALGAACLLSACSNADQEHLRMLELERRANELEQKAAIARDGRAVLKVRRAGVEHDVHIELDDDHAR